MKVQQLHSIHPWSESSTHPHIMDKIFFCRTFRVKEFHIYITMLTWRKIRNTEIPIVVILAHIELPRLNIFNCCLHFVVFIVRLRLEELEMNWWWLRVPLNVLDVGNSDSKNPVLLTTSTDLTKNKVTPSKLASEKSNNCFGVRIWFGNFVWKRTLKTSLCS